MNDERRTARWDRIRRNERDGAQADERIVELHRARTDILATLQAAKTALRDIESELGMMRLQNKTFTAEARRLRRDLRSHLVGTLPDEMLALIFEEVVGVYDVYERGINIDGCELDKTMVSAPFYLAAVCSKWRRIAIHHSCLWTLISTPTIGRKSKRLLGKRISCLLRRSSKAPLCIFLDWNQVEDWSTRFDLHNILERLVLHSSRWRIVEIILPDDADGTQIVEACQVPLHKLERIYLCLDNNKEGTCGKFMPFAPALREMALWCSNQLEFSSRVHYAALTSLHLWMGPHLITVWSTLQAVAPHLENLLLSYEEDSIGPSFHPEPLKLPRLKQLVLPHDSDEFVPYILALELPVLWSLSLPGRIESLRPFLEGVSPTVTSLTLSAGIPIEAADIDIFSVLQNVDTLTFDRIAPEMECDYTVPATFFDQREVWVDANVWPKLTKLVLAEGGELEDDGGNIVSFVQWRTVDLDTGPKGPETPLRLQEVVLDAEGVSPLKRQQVRQLLETNLPTRPG